ncbi:MAG TPA: hypothetical protein VFG88_04480, partial [Nocardioidaceae bacterium]|nr:hypothetical protein [Nocardioidaceae bacterium]
TALIGRYPHRLKTHGRWRLKQPSPGVFLWRTPHGYYYLVDHHGTHPLDRTIGDAAWTALTTTQATGITLHPAGDPIIEYHGTQHAS